MAAQNRNQNSNCRLTPDDWQPLTLYGVYTRMREVLADKPLAILLLAVPLSAILLFAGLGSIALINFNEARRAVTVREMLSAGDWLVPLMNGEPYLTKPPLFYWLALMTSDIAGTVNEWTLRFPSAVFGAICCLWVYWLGSRLRNRRTGLLAAAFTLANAGFSLHARSAEVEMTLAGLCVSSLMVAVYFLFFTPTGKHRYNRWILFSYTLIGACVLTKGPVSFIFTVLPVAVFWLLERNKNAAAYITSAGGWLLVIVVGGSWFAAVSLRDGFDIWHTVIQHDIVNKIAGGGPADPPYSYLVYLLGDFFPFWIILFVHPRRLWRQLRNIPQLKFVACAILVPLLVLSLFSAKNPKYLLPMYPWLALLLAIHWEQILMDAQGWRRRTMLTLPTIMLIGFTGFYLLGAKRVLAYRVQALPRISAAIAQAPELPVYHMGAPDMRLVFYVGKPIKSVHASETASIQTPAWLFASAPLPIELQALSSCATGHFKPYLSRHQELVLYKLDATCASGPHITRN